MRGMDDRPDLPDRTAPALLECMERAGQDTARLFGPNKIRSAAQGAGWWIAVTVFLFVRGYEGEVAAAMMWLDAALRAGGVILIPTYLVYLVRAPYALERDFSRRMIALLGERGRAHAKDKRELAALRANSEPVAAGQEVNWDVEEKVFRPLARSAWNTTVRLFNGWGEYGSAVTKRHGLRRIVDLAPWPDRTGVDDEQKKAGEILGHFAEAIFRDAGIALFTDMAEYDKLDDDRMALSGIFKKWSERAKPGHTPDRLREILGWPHGQTETPTPEGRHEPTLRLIWYLERGLAEEIGVPASEEPFAALRTALNTSAAMSVGTDEDGYLTLLPPTP